ncbi:F-box only protein 2 isoform X1 [Scomber japonicus]|uniref:F-box only protein 2 isoform X1 n=1 Tax=Scomber japonicus TaxID=13676 RepID=UPI00230582CA|nr:F-box only protein 2 isoform X1 [Scomber japonicus]
MTRNLLKNPSGEEQLEFWELTENGGSQWKVEDMPGDCGHDFCNDIVTKYFATSFELCLKRQVIDLLEEGYSGDQLDAQPTVTVEDWYCGRTDCGCTYQMTVCLLDENHEIIQEYKPDPITLDPDSDDCSWKQVRRVGEMNSLNIQRLILEYKGTRRSERSQFITPSFVVNGKDNFSLET